MGRGLRAALTVAVFSAILATVLLALATRDPTATVTPIGGVLITVLCGAVLFIAFVMIDSGVILTLALGWIGAMAVAGSWTALRSDGSTAAVGALWMPLGALGMAVVATVADRLAARVGRHRRRPEH